MTDSEYIHSSDGCNSFLGRIWETGALGEIPVSECAEESEITPQGGAFVLNPNLKADSN
jgi:hypothetical protein